MSETRPDEYPDGSVGRYVRERWAANARAAAEERPEPDAGQDATPRSGAGQNGVGQNGAGVGARRDEAWGVLPDDASWGSDVLEIDEVDDTAWTVEPDGPLPPASQAYAPPVPPQEAPPQDGPRQDQGWFQAPPPPSSTPPQVRPPQRPDPAVQAATPATVAPQQAPPPHEAPQPPAVRQAPPPAPDQERHTPPPSVGSQDPPTPPSQWRAAEPADPRRSGDRTPPGGMPQRPIRDVGRWTDPGAVAAQEAQRSRADSDVDGTDLSTARLLKPSRRRPPRTGWRRFLYLLTGRLINPGESPQDVRERELITRVNQPLLGCHKIATLSLKGGVGKTTITATLGATFASKRGDRVVAVDANPDRGTLSQKIPLETSATVRHLLRDAQRVRRYTDVRAYTSQGPSRLEVLASEQDPAVSEAYSEDDYRRTVTLLEHFYNIVLTDCGTGLMHSAMYGVLGVADQLIIVSSGSIDGARSASATMDWLEAHEHGDLVRNAIAVINNVHRQAGAVDLDRVAQHFAGRCRAVVQIPFDPHLEEGAEVDLDRLSQPTRIALLELAASVADGFPR
ncbi:MinD/ParA family ATP-binding protein [Pseudonocardia xishanensis]|uniref:CobQ/CobB/MinD/ParA nucleotide binding domain-containing protein n=1 Tax=Pseudonocardia xishanensis TaxID=630995 RepID=A0ABP8S253_9PSEU